MALAKAALPSARNSILPSASVFFFHASITNTSLTPVTAMVSMPLALILSALVRKPGRGFLWQGGVKAPGTANSTPFLPLNMSSVVCGLGPSAVITVNVAGGRRSPTLMVMMLPLWLSGLVSVKSEAQSSDLRGLVEPKWHLDRPIPGDGGEAQCGTVGLRIGRQPVELERKTLLPGGCAGNRFGHRQGPIRGRGFREQRECR